VNFRPASGGDLPGIVALLTDDPLGRSREAGPLDACYVAAFAAIDADPNQLLAVAEINGVLLGCLQLSFIPGLSRGGMWRGQIEAVRVAATRRGEGIGRKMLGWAIEQCRQRHCGLVQLTTDKARPEAHRFYASLGFVASHEGMKLFL
jgi:GNAT superfamily N-acetyltransferase